MATKYTRTCPECRRSFETGYPDKLFCSSPHQIAYNRRQLGRGQAIVSLVQAWRGAKGAKDPKVKEAAREAFGQFCRLADRMNTEDRDAQRLSALAVFRIRMAHWLLDLS